MSLDHQKTHGLEVQTETDNFYLSGRPCELSAFSFVPTQRHDPPQRTAFNSTKEVKLQSISHQNHKLELQFRRHQTYSDALKNSSPPPRTIPRHWNSLSPSVANTQSTKKFSQKFFGVSFYQNFKISSSNMSDASKER